MTTEKESVKTSKKTEVQIWKNNFLTYLEIEKGRSLKTIENYNRYLERFFDFAKIKEPKDILLSNIRDFRLFLNRQPSAKMRNKQSLSQNTEQENMKKNTQNYYLIALRTFLKFLAKNDITSLAPEKIELAKTEMRELDLVSEKEFQRFLEIACGDDFLDIRDRAIIETFYSTGLRISELCSLSRDIDLETDQFSIRGKGGKVRIIFLSERSKDYLKKYLKKVSEIENSSDMDWKNPKNKFWKKFRQKSLLNNSLFLSKNGTTISPRSIQQMIEKRALQASVSKKITPHTIRHFFATNLLKNGADIRSVQMLLGHASINTTQVYTNISDRFLEEVHKKFHNKKEDSL